MSDRLTPEREAEIAAAVAELDADRALSFGTWTASPVTEKTTLPPEQAFAVEGVARLGNATLRGSVGVFGDERHAAFTALARDAVPTLLAELAAVRAECDQAQARVAELEEQQERRRLRLIALQNDALNMRGSLAPNGKSRKVPFPLGETLTPAVDWLINRVAELEAELYTEQAHGRTFLEQRNAHAQELLRLRSRVAELEAAQQPAPYVVTPEAHAQMREGLTRYFAGESEPDAEDEGLSGPCDCGEGAVHYTAADCPAEQRTHDRLGMRHAVRTINPAEEDAL